MGIDLRLADVLKKRVDYFFGESFAASQHFLDYRSGTFDLATLLKDLEYGQGSTYFKPPLTRDDPAKSVIKKNRYPLGPRHNNCFRLTKVDAYKQVFNWRSRNSLDVQIGKHTLGPTSELRRWMSDQFIHDRNGDETPKKEGRQQILLPNFQEGTQAGSIEYCDYHHLSMRSSVSSVKI